VNDPGSPSQGDGRSPEQTRINLHAAGYDPVPVRGKWPHFPGWEKLGGANPNQIRMWTSAYFDHDSTGILTARTPALDIDILDPDAAKAVEDLVRSRFDEHGTLMVRFGHAPKRALLFRTDQPFTKITRKFAAPHENERLELLADGQQLVAFGIHPKTGKLYNWFGGSPGEVERQDLPEIRAGSGLDLINEAVKRLGAFGYRLKSGGDGGDGKEGEAIDWANCRDEDLIDHDTLASFAMKLLKAGMHDAAAVNMLKAKVKSLTGVDKERQERRIDEIPGIVHSARRKLDREPEPAVVDPLPNRRLGMSAWDNALPPPRTWGVLNKIPIRQPTLFSGEGAIGKSIIELQLAVAYAIGRNWLGFTVDPGPAIYLGAEDEADELHRRLHDILVYYGSSFAQLDKSLHVLDFTGHDMALALPDRRNGKIAPTPLFKQLLEMARDLKARHIGIDTSADAFGGNEIDRAQVRQFIGMLRQLAIAASGSVVLLSHPSLTGIATDSGISGSTHWHNGMRARMYLKASTKKENGDMDGEQATSDFRELQFKKNNYGPLSGNIVLRYNKGVFIPEAGVTSLDFAEHEQKVEKAFLDILAKLTAQKRPPSPHKHAPNYAPAAIVAHPDGKRFTKKDYENAMERLLERGSIRVERVGPPSKLKDILVDKI
jgi:RecA-family ATPase